MEVRIERSWKDLMAREWEAEYFAKLVAFVKDRYAKSKVFPPASKIFAAFDSCPVSNVKVVILGQDPYHNDGQANGLSFSVSPGVAFPPSLLNIFKEVSDDTGAPIPSDGDLTRWARQGVLMLNATLTVDAHSPGSHRGHGWERFTDAVISALSKECDNLVFILWGSYAIDKRHLIDGTRHLILTSPHPSPLSAYRGFFGNHHFTRANQWLREHQKGEIEW